MLKDGLALERIRSSGTLVDLLKLIAFQVGSEVSLNELATQVKLDVKTVRRYLDILEKGFVIVLVGGFSRNLRNEVTSKAKYYFLDNGVRSAVVGQEIDYVEDRDGGLFGFDCKWSSKKQSKPPKKWRETGRGTQSGSEVCSAETAIERRKRNAISEAGNHRPGSIGNRIRRFCHRGIRLWADGGPGVHSCY